MKMPGLRCLPPISIAAAGILLLLAASAPALAQGTEEERRACTPDVMRLCREFIPRVSAITQCLIDKRAELNPDCKLVMTPKPQPVQHAAAPKKRVAKRAAPPPPAVTRTVATTEPGAVIRPPMNILPPAEKAKPVRKKTPAAATAKSAAAAPANPQKKPAPKPQ